MLFNVHFLPASYGDSIWIEYGDEAAPKRILIDGGTGGTKVHIRALVNAIPGDRHFELMVVTHIDRDHIEGILSLLEEDELGFSVGDFWFNGWYHLPGNPLPQGKSIEQLGAVQGERLTQAILNHKLPWNKWFAGKAVAISDHGPLPEITLEGGLTLILLSPTIQNLRVLREAWQTDLFKANLIPGFGQTELQDTCIEQLGGAIPNIEALNQETFDEDTAAANGSSIAFVATYAGKSVLFAGDSFPSVILGALNRRYEGKAPIDLAKLSHHASAHNTSPALIEKLDCKRFAISTNGSIYKHPHQVTVARVIKRKGAGTELIFNYQSDYNRIWNLTSLKDTYQYVTTYPVSEGIKISILQSH